MEGNACYKFSTIRNWIAATGAKPIETVVDVGVNVGNVVLLIHDYFPDARIFGFEPVTEYFDMAKANTKAVPNLILYNMAFTASHDFVDDLGTEPREASAPLVVLKGLPAAGPGWTGGSVVLPAGGAMEQDAMATHHYQKLEQAVEPISLGAFMEREKLEEIDILKMDCEGCEHSTLGSADVDTLHRDRFIVGEYHGIERFSRIMQGKLFQTHKVSLFGDRGLGAFFAERLDGEADGILLHDKSGMLVLRPWLGDDPIDWHVFNEQYVLKEDRYWHALA